MFFSSNEGGGIGRVASRVLSHRRVHSDAWAGWSGPEAYDEWQLANIRSYSSSPYIGCIRIQLVATNETQLILHIEINGLDTQFQTRSCTLLSVFCSPRDAFTSPVVANSSWHCVWKKPTSALCSQFDQTMYIIWVQWISCLTVKVAFGCILCMACVSYEAALSHDVKPAFMRWFSENCILGTSTVVGYSKFHDLRALSVEIKELV